MITDKDKVIAEELNKLLPSHIITRPQNLAVNIKNCLLLIIAILIGAFYLRSGKDTIITIEQFNYLQEIVRMSAKCNDVSPSSIYTEIKRKYNIYDLHRLPSKIYEQVIESYGDNVCEME